MCILKFRRRHKTCRESQGKRQNFSADVDVGVGVGVVDVVAFYMVYFSYDTVGVGAVACCVVIL